MTDYLGDVALGKGLTSTSPFNFGFMAGVRKLREEEHQGDLTAKTRLTPGTTARLHQAYQSAWSGFNGDKWEDAVKSSGYDEKETSAWRRKPQLASLRAVYSGNNEGNVETDLDHDAPEGDGEAGNGITANANMTYEAGVKDTKKTIKRIAKELPGLKGKKKGSGYDQVVGDNVLDYEGEEADEERPPVESGGEDEEREARPPPRASESSGRAPRSSALRPGGVLAGVRKAEAEALAGGKPSGEHARLLAFKGLGGGRTLTEASSTTMRDPSVGMGGGAIAGGGGAEPRVIAMARALDPNADNFSEEQAREFGMSPQVATEVKGFVSSEMVGQMSEAGRGVVSLIGNLLMSDDASPTNVVEALSSGVLEQASDDDLESLLISITNYLGGTRTAPSVKKAQKLGTAKQVIGGTRGSRRPPSTGNPRASSAMGGGGASGMFGGNDDW